MVYLGSSRKGRMLGKGELQQPEATTVLNIKTNSHCRKLGFSPFKEPCRAAWGGSRIYQILWECPKKPKALTQIKTKSLRHKKRKLLEVLASW